MVSHREVHEQQTNEVRDHIPRQIDSQVGERLVTNAAACRRLSLGPTTLWQLTSSGEILSLKVGKRRLILESSIDAFIGRRLAAEQAKQATTA